MTPEPAVARIARDPGSDAWLVEFDGEPRAHTYGRNLEEARENAREVAVLWFDADAVVMFDLDLGDDLNAEVARTHAVRSEAEEASRRSTAALRAAARRLVGGEHLTYRDAADLLGVSHQRIAQLVKD
jgi:predicted RNase H-like HicB family nuclease